MSKAKFAAAKELINEKDYAGARTILKTIDHPIAREWERRLDTISPTPTRNNMMIVGIAAAVTIGFLLIAVIVLLLRPQQPPYVIAALESTATIPTSDSQLVSSLPPTWTPSPIASVTPTCDARKWWEDAEPIVIDFLDTSTTAGQTPRAALASVLLTLNSTYRKFDRLKSQDCDAGIGIEIAKGMKLAVDGFNDFLGKSETFSQYEFSIANQHFFNAYRLLGQQNIEQLDSRIGSVESIWGGANPSVAMGQALANIDDQQFLSTLVSKDIENTDLTLTAIFATSTALFKSN